MSVAAAAALGACGTTYVNHDTAGSVAASIAQLLDLPAFKKLPKELQDGALQPLWEKHARLQAQERAHEGHQRPAPSNQTVSGVLHDRAASDTTGAGARQSTPSLGIICDGRDVHAQSFLPASQAAAAQAAADAFMERLQAGSESTLQAAASAAAPARASSLVTAAATHQRRGEIPQRQSAVGVHGCNTCEHACKNATTARGRRTCRASCGGCCCCSCACLAARRRGCCSCATAAHL